MTAYSPNHAFDVPPGEPQPGLFTLIFRRLRMWRKPTAAPAVCAGTAPAPVADGFPCCFHCNAGSPCEPRDSHREPCPEGCNEALGDRTLSEVRAEQDAQRHADAMHAGYANAVDRLRREAGLPTVAQMHAMRAGSPAGLFPPLAEPLHAEPQPRGPVHDTRMDVYAPHYSPDVPVYQEAPVARVLEAERLGRVMTP